MDKIFILGGTIEACELAKKLVAQGHDVTTSFAGRTTAPQTPPGKIRIGGFSTNGKDGAEGLVDFITAEKFDRLIDATHPFARKISQNAKAAAQKTGVTFECITRPPWQQQKGDRWQSVANESEAAKALPENARAFIALGSKFLSSKAFADFAARKNVWFLLRMVDAPKRTIALAQYEILLAKPGGLEAETELLKHHKIGHIICRNSGGQSSYVKIEAARRLGIKVIMIER